SASTSSTPRPAARVVATVCRRCAGSSGATAATRVAGGQTSLREADRAHDLVGRHRAARALELAPALKEDEGGDRLDAEAAGDFGDFVGIELHHDERALARLGDLFEFWRGHAAGAAPR